VCLDAPVGDWPGVRRRLTLRGVLDAAGDGVAAEDEFAVALRRVGIGAWRGGNRWLILLRREICGGIGGC
jgi:hypothetical protein